jgi:hypothetical protein
LEKAGVDIRGGIMSIVVYLFVVASENVSLCGFVWTDGVASIEMKLTLSKCDRLMIRTINTKGRLTRPLKNLLPSTVGPRIELAGLENPPIALKRVSAISTIISAIFRATICFSVSV